jgi:hypothetical protein
MNFLSDMCLFKRPLSHALQLLGLSFFLQGSLLIVHNLLLLSHIKLKRWLGGFHDVSLYFLTQTFSMLEVYPCLLPSMGYYPEVHFSILLLVFV